MPYLNGIDMYWSSEEQAILEDGLARYSSSEPSISRYAKIALVLQHKNARDVAMCCRWIYKRKENNKRIKYDHNRSTKVKVENKEIIDMVFASTSPPSLVLSEEDGITIELIKQNEQLLDQISANLRSLRLTENLSLLYKSHEIIMNLLENLDKNVPETMKNMPPLNLPKNLCEELLYSFHIPSNLPKLL